MGDLREKRINAEVEVNLSMQSLAPIEDDDIDAEVVPTSRSNKTVAPELISRARALYIANNMSLREISSHLGLNLYTLQDYCKNQKWSIFRADADITQYSEELFDEIYNNLDFYDKTRTICNSMIHKEEYQNPRDMKTIVETFKQADERSTSLRIIATTASKGIDE